MNIYTTLIGAIIAYTAFGIFTAKAGGKINDILLALLTNGVATVMLLCMYVFSASKYAAPPTRTGTFYAVLAGAAIGLFSWLLASLFGRAENISFIMPVVYGATLVIGSLFGFIIFKDRFSAIGVLGLAVTAVGVGLIVYSRVHAS